MKRESKKRKDADEPIRDAEYVILKSNDFKYPNKQEFIKFHSECPKLQIFGFEHNHPLVLIVNESISIDEASRTSNLYWWENCLINRFEKVCHTYTFLATHYSRGFSDDWRENTNKQAVNHIMFEYYAEVFYYYFFSSRDILAQILCAYYSIPIKEDKISFNQKFITSIIELDVKNILKKFDKGTAEAKEFRNGFTHRFTPNIPDHRSVISEDGRALSFGGGRFLQSERIKNNIDKSLNSLSLMMTELRTVIIKN